MKTRLFVLAMFFVLAISGCAPTLQTVRVSDQQVQEEKEKQLEMVIADYKKKEARLNHVAFDLLIASSELTEANKQRFGMAMIKKGEIAPQYREAMAKSFNLSSDVPYIRDTYGPAKEF